MGLGVGVELGEAAGVELRVGAIVCVVSVWGDAVAAAPVGVGRVVEADTVGEGMSATPARPLWSIYNVDIQLRSSFSRGPKRWSRSLKEPVHGCLSSQ